MMMLSHPLPMCTIPRDNVISVGSNTSSVFTSLSYFQLCVTLQYQYPSIAHLMGRIHLPLLILCTSPRSKRRSSSVPTYRTQIIHNNLIAIVIPPSSSSSSSSYVGFCVVRIVFEYSKCCGHYCS